MAISTALDSLSEGLGPGLGHTRKAIINPYILYCSFTLCFKLVSVWWLWRLVEGGRESDSLGCRGALSQVDRPFIPGHGGIRAPKPPF